MGQRILEALNSIDVNVFCFFNGTCRSTALDEIFQYITVLADSKVLFLAAILMLLIRKKNIRAYGILLLAGITLSYYSSHFLKYFFMRARPFMAMEEATAVIAAGGYSFPSGHATSAFMAAFILSSCFRRWVLFFCLAVLVGISRVYLGVHYPADVLAGAVLGTLIGYLLVVISNVSAEEI